MTTFTKTKDYKVLFVLPTDYLGGAEQFLKMIASYYANHNADVTVFFINNKKHKGWNDIEQKATIIYGRGEQEREGIFTLVKNLIKYRYTLFNIAFTSHSHTTALLGLLKRLKVIRINHIVARESTLVFSRFSGFRLLSFLLFYKAGFPAVTTLICQTCLMKQQLDTNIPKILKKIPNVIVLNNPINLKEANELGTRMTLQSPASKRYIVSAGRLIEEKGFDLLIRSFGRISDFYKDLQLVILGEGGLRATLQNITVQLHLSEKVIMPGRVENVFPYFKHAELCVISSRIEGFPNVLLQMMSQNGNVVSTLCAGGIEHIPGLITCQPNNQKELELAILEGLDKNEKEIKMNWQIFQHYLTDRTVGKFIAKVEKIIDSNGEI